MLNLKLNKPTKSTASPQPGPQNPSPLSNPQTEAENLPPDLHPAQDSAQPSNTSSPQTDAPTHFDELIEGAESAERVEQQQAIKSTMLREEDFRVLFVKGLSGLSMVTGIESLRLPNTHVDVRGAEDCADAIYGTIVDIPALHFMLSPGNKWLERAFVVGMFSFGMVKAIEAEALAKVAAKKQAATMDYSKAKAATTAADAKRKGPSDVSMPDDSQRSALVGV